MTKSFTQKDFDAALAQPAVAEQHKQEPVAWMHPSGGVVQRLITGFDRELYTIPLYTTPPQRKPLTRGQIREIEVDVSLNQSFDYITPAEQLCRAIEAAHGIKE